MYSIQHDFEQLQTLLRLVERNNQAVLILLVIPLMFYLIFCLIFIAIIYNSHNIITKSSDGVVIKQQIRIVNGIGNIFISGLIGAYLCDFTLRAFLSNNIYIITFLIVVISVFVFWILFGYKFWGLYEKPKLFQIEVLLFTIVGSVYPFIVLEAILGLEVINFFVRQNLFDAFSSSLYYLLWLGFPAVLFLFYGKHLRKHFVVEDDKFVKSSILLAGENSGVR